MRFCPGSRIDRLMLIPGQKSLSRFEKRAFFAYRDNSRCPDTSVNRFMCEPVTTLLDLGIDGIPPILLVGVCGL